nr:hypothetical protein GCM10017745_45390 [Saccharothrix mutabilis subsp. capreolus]
MRRGHPRDPAPNTATEPVVPEAAPGNATSANPAPHRQEDPPTDPTHSHAPPSPHPPPDAAP